MEIRGKNGKSSFSAGRARFLGATGLIALSLTVFSGCTNNLLKLASNAAGSGIGGNPLAGIGTSSGNTSGLALSSVQFDTFNPTSTLDLLGDGSGSMGNDCQPKANDASGATTCTCAYTYIQSNGVQIGPVEVDTSYHESDMLRCSYSLIPAGVSYITVYVHLTASDTKTNQVTLNLSGATNGALDLSNPLSFTQASRFQCRDIVFVPYLWDPTTIYDPFVSEDPQYSYPLNFYTTNMGLTFSEYAGGGSTGWNCPALPNDTAAGMDLTLYSISADSSGSKSIFPPQGTFDRSTFYVANAQAGVFTIPVNAFVFPGTVSVVTSPTGGLGGAAAGAGGGASPPPLGYAASPIPLTGGGETCPDSSVVIPPGYHWAKLWMFRDQLPQRHYSVSNNLAGFGSAGLACNSTPWTQSPPAPPNDTEFPDCSGAPNWASLDANHLAARFSLATGQCFEIFPGAATNPLTGFNYDGGTVPPGTNKSPKPAYAAINFTPFAPGTDIWTPWKQDHANGCGGTAVTDTSHACQASTGNVPWDSGDLAPVAIDSSTASPRFDYLFVVSPVSVNRQDMLTTASSTTHSVYTPVRFMSPTDCKSADPDAPTFPGDCSPTRMLTYGITVSEAGAGGQLGSSDPDEPGDFPMCVLQPN